MKKEILSNELDRVRISEQLCCEIDTGTQINELGIGGAAKRFRSAAKEWRRKPEPRKARRSHSLSLSKGATATPRNLKSNFVKFSVYFCAGITLAVLLFMIGYILVKVVRMTTETLTGIPSITYGLFGMLLFVGFLHWGYSLMAGVGKLRTVFTVVLPSAVPGILSGIILATGRVVGETAALIYTPGTVAQIPQNLFGSGRTLAIHMYVLSSEGLHTNQAFATAVVLLIMVIGINALTGLVARQIKK